MGIAAAPRRVLGAPHLIGGRGIFLKQFYRLKYPDFSLLKVVQSFLEPDILFSQAPPLTKHGSNEYKKSFFLFCHNLVSLKKEYLQ